MASFPRLIEVEIDNWVWPLGWHLSFMSLVVCSATRHTQHNTITYRGGGFSLSRHVFFFNFILILFLHHRHVISQNGSARQIAKRQTKLAKLWTSNPQNKTRTNPNLGGTTRCNTSMPCAIQANKECSRSEGMYETAIQKKPP